MLQLLFTWRSVFLKFDKQGKLSTKIYDKRDDFNFPIVNFPYLSSNIPSSPAYGVFASQLIRFARASSLYKDFLERSMLLAKKTVDTGISNAQAYIVTEKVLRATPRACWQIRCPCFTTISWYTLCFISYFLFLAWIDFWEIHDGWHMWSRRCSLFRNTWPHPG